MASTYSIIFYIFAFLSVYVQVFFLVTFFEKRKHIVYHKESFDLHTYPRVTVVIPCYNEQNTIDKTIASLQALDYPKDKVSIFIVDDGSTDNTWNVLQKFKNINNIQIFQKENGGKHTCLNLGLENCETEFFGCLDADSFVHPQALKRIMSYFQNDKNTMAVAPSIIVHNAKNILQKAQKVDYDMAVYTKKMLGFMGGIHVTPGPFSIFRKKVFDDLGHYHKAHNTEDQEIALRMQEHGYKIDHCPDAYVYTVSPNTIPKLYRQRLRWIYGFIRNVIDYRRLLFKRKFGSVALFTLPSGIISVVGVVFLFGTIIYNIGAFIYNKLIEINTVGLSNGANFHFDWFFFSTKANVFMMIFLYVFVVTATILGRKMTKESKGFSFTVIYFILIYSIVAPFWMMKALWNALRSKESSWTLERKPSNI